VRGEEVGTMIMIEFSVLGFLSVRSLFDLLLQIVFQLVSLRCELLLDFETIIKTKIGVFEDNSTTISNPCLKIEALVHVETLLLMTFVTLVGGVMLCSGIVRYGLLQSFESQCLTIVIAFVGESKGCQTAISDPSWMLISYLTVSCLLKAVLLISDAVEYHAGREFCAVEILYCFKTSCLTTDCLTIAGQATFKATEELAIDHFIMIERLRPLLPAGCRQGLRSRWLVVCSLANEKFQSFLTYLKRVSLLMSVVLS